MAVDTGYIESLLAGAEPAPRDIASVLEKAGKDAGLSLEDASVLLRVKDASSLREIGNAANRVKERVFGKRVVLFAPLYLSNYCTNGCSYCGFRSSNRSVARKALTPEEVVREARVLEGMGFKRVLLVTGEDARWGLDYVIECVRAVYRNTGIRVVHVNAPPMGVEEFRELKKSGAAVYQAFQETYHRPTYEKMHPTGRKRDYDFRLSVMDRALQAGFEDVGIGALLGLYDFRFDALASIAHSMHLYKEFGTHAHTISIPRLRPAEDFVSGDIPWPVSDNDLKLIVAFYRLAVPSAGVVVSTREGEALRAELLHFGATQLSAASRTNPGGYAAGEKTLEQFATDDHRSLEEVMRSVTDEGYLPSLCTTCYRVGRTGHEFTEKTLAGEMGKFCQANAVLTLKEFLLDHAKNGAREDIKSAIESGIEAVKDPSIRKALIEKIKELEDGKRDLFF